MLKHKRRKLSGDEGSDHQESDETVEDFHSEPRSLSYGSDDESEHDSCNTDDELDAAKNPKSRQTSKRKLRATGAAKFGATLQTLLHTDAPSSLPLSLKPSIARKRNDEKLELKTKKVLEGEKKEREEKGRVKDVIAGWDNGSERALRKVAQRGVVKLFNVIQQAQASAAATAEDDKAARGARKSSLPTPVMESKGKGRGKAMANCFGRGKESAVAKEDFFDMIRSGGVVSQV